MVVVLMGVSGSGKTTIGTLLAQKTGTVFADADDYHPAANKQKMAAGQPLNDDDRQPWLEELNRLLQSWFHQWQGRRAGVFCVEGKISRNAVGGNANWRRCICAAGRFSRADCRTAGWRASMST